MENVGAKRNLGVSSLSQGLGMYQEIHPDQVIRIDSVNFPK